MSSVGFLIFDGLWREISARVSRFVRSASGRTAEKRRNLARSKMRGFLSIVVASYFEREAPKTRSDMEMSKNHSSNIFSITEAKQTHEFERRRNQGFCTDFGLLDAPEADC